MKRTRIFVRVSDLLRIADAPLPKIFHDKMTPLERATYPVGAAWSHPKKRDTQTYLLGLKYADRLLKPNVELPCQILIRRPPGRESAYLIMGAMAMVLLSKWVLDRFRRTRSTNG